MKKLNYLFLLIPFLLLSCSKDSGSSTTPAPTYSVVGLWKTTSAVLNGVEKFGGNNPVKSETYYFNSNGSLTTQSYSDTNYSNLYGSSTGTYSIPSSSTIILNANAYNAAGSFLGSYNQSCQVLLLSATELQIKTLNYPAANDVYIKKFIR
jgi:hypothetical protein